MKNLYTIIRRQERIDILVVLRNAFRSGFELVFTAEDILPLPFGMWLGFTEIFYEFICRDHTSQARRVAQDVGSEMTK